MKTVNRIIRYLVAIVFIITIAVPGSAMPAFARKYQISCQVCHSPFPRLKPFGEDFAGNGFRMTEYEAPRYYTQSGDDKLNLLREIPLAVRFDGFASYNFANNKAVDFVAPFGLKLISGGELSEKISYYFYFYLNERGKIAGIEDALLLFSDLFGSGINMALGQFQACDPLYKRETRLTLEDYKIYTVKPGNTSISLKYDRGVVFDYGFKTGTDIVVLVLNGNGIEEADESFVFDKDKYKNFMGKVSQSIGKSLSVGFFGYTGKEMLIEEPDLVTSEVLMYGPNLSINLNEKFIVNFQYMRRTDSKVYNSITGLYDNDNVTDGAFAEFIYAPKGDMSNWYFTGLLNWVDSDITELDYKSATFHAGYMLKRNIRLVSEFSWISEQIDYGKVSVGFVASY